jgi:phosphoribosylglycinamide formyltransferase-1
LRKNNLPYEPTRIAILISGRGSNMVALSKAISRGAVPNAKIVVVVSDKPSAGGLLAAKELGHETLVVERKRTRQEHETEMIEALRQHQVDLVCLAGFMRLLSPGFTDAFPQRILNIHPSLLPSFPGLDAQKQAIEHGAKFSGCTVHFVDDTLDGGPIIAQRVVPILDDDTEQTLAARILEQEHSLYAEALALVVSGKFEIVGRRVISKDVRKPGSE